LGPWLNLLHKALAMATKLPKGHPKKSMDEWLKDGGWVGECKKFEYVIRDGLRWVPAYDFDFHVNAKQRWLGMTVLDILLKEFPYYDEEYYRSSLLSGRITVNDAVVSPDFKLRDGDSITHVVNRKEPPVSEEPPQIICDTDEICVVSKPSTVPVRFNHVIPVSAEQLHRRILAEGTEGIPFSVFLRRKRNCMTCSQCIGLTG